MIDAVKAWHLLPEVLRATVARPKYEDGFVVFMVDRKLCIATLCMMGGRIDDGYSPNETSVVVNHHGVAWWYSEHPEHGFFDIRAYYRSQRDAA